MLLRQQWSQAIACGPATGRFVFIDESSAKANMTRLYGWGFGGERLMDAVPHGHWSMTTMIAAVGAKALFIFEGPMDLSMFCAYGKHMLVPGLRAENIVDG